MNVYFARKCLVLSPKHNHTVIYVATVQTSEINKIWHTAILYEHKNELKLVLTNISRRCAVGQNGLTF